MMFVTAAFWLTLMLVAVVAIVSGFLNLMIATDGLREAAFYTLVIFLGIALFLWASGHAADALIVVLRAANAR